MQLTNQVKMTFPLLVASVRTVRGKLARVIGVKVAYGEPG
jgi:hypothetical protein